MTITEVGVKLKSLSRYELKGYTHDITLSAKNFLLNFITLYNEKYYTVEGSTTICAPKYARSIEDIYRITKFYYPKITLRIIMTHLTEWVKSEDMNVLFCSAIKKRVFNIKYTQFNSFGEEGSNYYKRYTGLEIGQDEHGFTGDDYLNLLN